MNIINHTIEQNSNPKLQSPLALAFLGDAVYELMVREHLAKMGTMPAHQLHVKAVKLVKAAAQAKGAEAIMPKLTEDEISIFKRGRNAHSNTMPKNANPQEYRHATGLEALFGYLHLKGEYDRERELFNMILNCIDGEE